MKSTEEYLSILRDKKEYLMQKYQISCLGLFGSVARQEQPEESEDDLGLLSEVLAQIRTDLQ